MISAYMFMIYRHTTFFIVNHDFVEIKLYAGNIDKLIAPVGTQQFEKYKDTY